MVSRFLWHVLALPMEFFTQRHAGDIASRVAANEQIARLLSGGARGQCAQPRLARVLRRGHGGLRCRARGDRRRHVACRTSLALKLIGQPPRGPQPQPGARARQARRQHGRRRAHDRDAQGERARGRRLRSLGRIPGEGPERGAATRRVYSAVLDMLPTLFSALTTAAILGVGGLRVIDGALTLGGLVAFQSLMASFSEPINALVQLAAELPDDQGRLARLEDVLQLSGRTRGRRCARRRALAAEAVRADRAARHPVRLFTARAAADRRLSLDARAGHARGAGRRIRQRQVDARPADLRAVQAVVRRDSFDGWPLPEIPPEVLANSVAYVDQDIFLFEGTVRDNLTLWDTTVPRPTSRRRSRTRHPRRHRDPRGQLRLLCQRRRHELQRRPAPAHRDRARAGRQSVDPGARRGDRRARPDHREGDRRQSAASRLHLHHHRASPEHDPRLRRDHRARAGQGRRARHARGADRRWTAHTRRLVAQE